MLTSEQITRFEYLLRQDPRNLPTSDFLSTDTGRVRDDTRKILTDQLLSSNERDTISRWFRTGEGNTPIARRIAEMLFGRAGAVEIPGNVTATSYYANSEGLHVTNPLYAGFRTWEEVAAIFRSLWQQELDGFSHEPPAVDISEPEQAEAGAVIPPEPEAVPEPTGAGAPEQPESSDTAAAEPDLTPNVEEYLNLKAAHPDKIIGVQVGGYMLFYGKDAEEAAPALGTKLPVRDIPGLGVTPVTGSNLAWQATLKDLLGHGKSVVLARPDPEHGPDAPYEIIKERDAAEYIPIGMELTIDGRHMKIDSVDYARGEVMLLDMDIKGYMPVFSVQPVPYVRQFVEEQQDRDFEANIQREMEALTFGSLEEQDHAEADDLETAKQLIRDFCGDMYQVEEMDFSNPEHIGIAYTTTEDEKHEIQVEVNLLDFSISQLVDDVCVEKRSYDSLRELIDNELTDLVFDELVRLKHDLPPEPERVELDGGKITPQPNPVTTKVVGRADTGAFEVVIEEMHFGPEKHNFHITDDNLGVGGDKTKYQYNVAAIRTLKQIEADGRLATPEEQAILSRYVGWGGLAPAFDPDNEKWAKEYAGLTYEQEAELYYMLDQTRGKLRLGHATKALVESGANAEIIDVKQRVEDAGFVWALDRPTGEPFEISVTRAVINAYRLLGGAAFSRMLGLIAGAWHGTPSSLKASIFSGMALFVKTYETELVDQIFIKRLSAVDPDEIIRRGKVDFSTNKASLRFARVILSKYNSQQRGGRKLPYRYKG